MTWQMDNGKGIHTGPFLAKYIDPRRVRKNELGLVIAGDNIGRIVTPMRFYRDGGGRYTTVDVVDIADSSVKYTIPCKYFTLVKRK